MKVTSISRRNLIAALSAGVVVGACSDNPATGRSQFVLISDEELAALGREAWRDALSPSICSSLSAAAALRPPCVRG